MIRLICVFILSILLTNQGVSQKKDKYLKQLKKVDADYKIGNYEDALDRLEKKYYGKVEKKLGLNNKYIPLYYLRKAKINWALGIVVGFEKFINNALSSSASIYGKNTREHAETQISVAEIYNLYGNFVKTGDILENAENTLENANLTNKDLEAKIDLTKMEMLVGQGFYNEALETYEEYEEFFKNRASDRETFVDENGKMQNRRVPDEELIERYNDYAKLQTLRARTLGEMGQIDEAYNAFEKTREWIRKENVLGPSSYAYVENQFYFGSFKISSGLSPDALMYDRVHKEESFIRTLTNLKRRHEESHYLAFEIYKEQIKQYLITNQMARYRTLRVEYEKAIKKNFPRNSLNFINLATVEFNSKLEKERNVNLEDRAKSILANIQSLPDLHEKRVEVLDFLHRVSIKTRSFNDAEKYLKDIIEIKKGLYGEDAPKYHLAKVDLANFYVDYTDKYSEAENIYTESFFNIATTQITESHENYIITLNHLAKLEESRDNYSKAEDYLDQALDAAIKKYKDPMDVEYGKELEKVASLQISIGDYEKARTNIDKVFEIYDEIKLHKDEYRLVHYVMALETEARLLGIEGYFGAAEDNIDRTKDLIFEAKTLEGYNEYAADDQLAELYIYLGRYNVVSEGLNELITLYEETYGDNSAKLINALVNKARLLMLTGNYSEAENTITRAEDIAIKTKGNESTDYSSTQLLHGELYINIGDYEKAIEALENSVKIEEDVFGRIHVRVALALSQLAIAKYYNGENLEEAEEILLESRDIIGKKLTNSNPRYADVSTKLAKVYISEEKPNEAIASLSVAQDIWLGITGRRGKRNNVNLGKINVLVGDVYYSIKDYKEAESYYNKALVNFGRTLNERHPEYVKVLSKLSRVYYMEKDQKKAKQTMETAIESYRIYIQEYFATLSEREKAKFWNTIRPDFEFYNTMAFESIDQDRNSIGKVFNNALLTKALLLNSSIKIRESILSSGDPDLIKIYNDWQTKKDEMTRVLSLSAEQMAQNNIDPSKLSSEIEDLEKQLSAQSDIFGGQFDDSEVTWENVQEVLSPNQVAIEMVRYRHFNHVFTDSVIYAVMYVKNRKELKDPEVILLTDGYNLENRYFKSYRNSIIYRIRDPKSYDAYWKPIVDKIGNLSTIYLSPDGVYNQINLEAIPTEDEKYVIDNSNIILISNTKDIYLNSKKEESKSTSDELALMFGNPDYYIEANAGEISPLPGTEIEVTQLRKLLSNGGINADYYVQDEATEKQVKKIENPNILHIATHGFFTAEKKSATDMELNESKAAENPLLRTGLILTGGGDLLNKTTFNYNMEDGILTAYEAMNLSLDKTDLVVLSACETGLGQLEMGEGVYGLQRAFLVAGAKTLIMSMFKVDDEATQKLMVKFYKKWLETDNKRKAFIDAKKELRIEYKDPIFWGAFIMMGLD